MEWRDKCGIRTPPPPLPLEVGQSRVVFDATCSEPLGSWPRVVQFALRSVLRP